MKLKRHKNFLKNTDFINEHLNQDKEFSVIIDFAYDGDLDEYSGKTDEEKLNNAIKKILRESKSDIYIKSFNILSIDGGSGHWPEVKFITKNAEDMYNALMILWDNYIDEILYVITSSLISEDKYKEAFDLVKNKSVEYLEYVDFSEDFIQSLSSEDKNLLASIKGINKYNL